MEYIIVDSENKWLASDNNKERIIREFEEMKKNRTDGNSKFFYGDTIYLYQAKELKRYEFPN